MNVLVGIDGFVVGFLLVHYAIYLKSNPTRVRRKALRELRAELAEAHTLLVEYDRALRAEKNRSSKLETDLFDARFDTLQPGMRREP